MTAFKDAGVAPEMLLRARAWFDREMARLEQIHGDNWPNVRDWLADYVSAEACELAAQQTQGGAR